MALSVTEEFGIDATPEQVMQALLAVDRIPEWSPAHKEVVIESYDDEGRPRMVRQTIAMLGVTDVQLLEHFWTDEELRWTLVHSDKQKSQDGTYRVTSGADGTVVQASISMEPKIPIPSFLLRQGQKRALSTVKDNLPAFVLANYT